MSEVAANAERAAPVEGMVGTREHLIFGWLVDLENPARKRRVEIFVGGRSVGFAYADRPHMVAKHGGDGYHGFAFYYADEAANGAAEVSASEAETAMPLRWKNRPVITQGERSGPPLEIEGLRISDRVEILGRVGAYPGKDMALEIWSGEQRSETTIPLSLPKPGGPFAAEVPSALLPLIFSDDSEIALPGLKEAGLAIPLQLLLATVIFEDEVLTIELSGKVELSGQVPLIVRLVQEQSILADLPVVIASNVASVPVPKDFRFVDNSVQIFLDDAAVPVRLHHKLLRDPQFKSIGHDASPWRVSLGSKAERGFFAFQANLSEQLNLSGNMAHITRNSAAAPLRLAQQVSKEALKEGSIAIVARASEESQLVTRIFDECGVLSEESTGITTASSWHLLRLQVGTTREVSGDVLFEVEARGDNVEFLQVAIGSSTSALPAEPVLGNVLSNPKLELWPQGVGIRQHSGRGEIAAGWRLLNKDSSDAVFTRAIVHPADSAIGLALAAPKVPKWLRVEADFVASPALSETMMVKFRAGIPAAARQLLANERSAVPQFTVIHAITIIHRTHVASAGLSSTREKVIARSARKVTIRHDVEQIVAPITVDQRREKVGDAPEGGGITESYHLAFEFRESAVLGLFDVEVLPQSMDVSLDPPKLQLEDSNIELQISELVGLENWTSDEIASRSRSLQPSARQLKWSIDASREPVEVVIPVFNALPETLGCLESLIGSTRVPMLVRLVDDGSEEPVREALQAFACDKPWVELQSLGTNRGYTYAADFGVRQAEAEWVVLLNSDTIVTRGWLEGLLACAKSDPQTAFVGPVSNAASFQSVPELYDASGKWKVNNLPAGMTPDDMAGIVARVSQHSYPKVPLLNGFCTLIRRSAFLELGGLNIAAFPMGYGEENDLCLRAGKGGYKLAVADDVFVYHVKSASFGSARRAELSKAGNLALRELHPDVDINVLTKQFRDTVALVALRAAVARELAAHGRSLDTVAVMAADEFPGTTIEQADTPREVQKA